MRIATILAAGFGGLILITVSVVLALNFWSGRETALELLREQIQIPVDMVESQLDAHLAPVSRANSEIAKMITSGEIDLEDHRHIRVLMRGAMTTTPQISAMAILHADGRVMRFTRLASRFRTRELDLSKNPQIRSALADARGKRQPYWGELFWSRELKSTLLNRRSPLFLKGKYIGLLVTAVRVSDLSRFLDRLDSTSPTDKSFLLYGPDLVLAHSNMSSGTYQRAESRALPRRDQVADLVLSNLWGSGNMRGRLKMKDGITESFVMAVLNTSYAVIYRPITS